MTFVLPDEGVTPAELLADPDFLTELTDSESKIYGEVQWSVPKFDVSSDLDLIPALTGMGITDVLYRGTADFTPLVDLTPVWLDQARQIARVKVDEEGVEAAAVTLLAADASEAIVRLGGHRRGPRHLRHGSGPALPVCDPGRGCRPFCGRGGAGINTAPAARCRGGCVRLYQRRQHP